MKYLELALWLMIFGAVYSMFLYPLLMFALSKVYKKRFVRQAITPKFSLIIAAYNEEKAIAAKIENSLAIDYPRENLEIIVASDASTDRTDEIVRSFADRGVRLLRFEGGLGKSAMLNKAVDHATGEILGFSDATGMWSEESVRSMAEHFADPRVGCVSGWVAYRYDRSLTAQGFNVYQRFVMAVRRAEASFGAGFNAPGSIHSVRKSMFIPCPPDTFMDMGDPFHIAMQGYRTTFEERAISWEESRTEAKDEFRARMRINLRSWRFMFYAIPRLPIFRSPMYCFQLVSHKFLRWTIGPSLIPIFILNALLLEQGWLYRFLFACQVAYYGATLVGVICSKMGVAIRGLSGLVFFNTVNFAYLIALLKFIGGARAHRWVPSR